ncbi:MAG: PorP/SprF family type IX secretion system membrane protein [Saprospiraceae bacterium]|nr:PorP/SprF family type IX secretion system membrane protein [Saprospiraceae bacterium]
MKKLLLAVVCFLTIQSGLNAQDEAIYSQYIFHPILVNPAYAGFKQDYELLFNFRNTHAGFPGAPRTYTLSFNGPIAPKLGFVGLLFNDKAGDLNKFKGQAGLAYKFDLGTVKLNAGLAAQFQKIQLANGAILDSGIDPSDPLIRAAADGLNFFNTSIGIYGEQSEKLFFGISVVDLVRTRIDDIQSITDQNSFFKYFNAWLGYRWNVANYNFTVEPSIMIKRLRNVPFQTDLNLKMSFLDEQLFGGVSYSIGGFSKTSFMLGTRINSFKLFYSYDVALEDFQKYNNGSHELSLSFMIKSAMSGK